MICFGVANDGGLRCRSHFEETLRQLSFAARRGTRRTAARRADYWRWLRFTTGRRARAAKIGGVTLQIVRGPGDEVQYPWSLRAHRRQGAGSNAAPDERAPRSPGSHGGGWPDPCRSWRGALAACRPLPAKIFEAFHVVVSTQTMSRELRAMDYRKLSARSRHHAQATNAIPRIFHGPPGGNRAGERTSIPGSIKVWFADEARVGQKNKITRALGQARNASLSAEATSAHRLRAYIFGAILASEEGQRRSA